MLNVGNFRGVVLGHKILVFAARHDDCPRPDRPQSALEIAAIDLIFADVSVLPRPNLGEEIVGVPFQVVFLPVAHEILQRGKTELTMKAITEEAMGISPGDVYARESSQA